MDMWDEKLDTRDVFQRPANSPKIILLYMRHEDMSYKKLEISDE